MESDLRIGSTVWIDHTPHGDVYYKVKLILERQPSDHEFCKDCAKGHLSIMGHLMQAGILDDKIYAVMNCDKCCAITVFIYHVEAGYLNLPERANCEDKSV